MLFPVWEGVSGVSGAGLLLALNLNKIEEDQIELVKSRKIKDDRPRSRMIDEALRRIDEGISHRSPYDRTALWERKKRLCPVN